MQLIDTHCHLNDRQAFPLPEAAVNEALAAGVVRMVVVGVDTASSQYAVELAERFESVFAVVGWHPNSASAYSSVELAPIREMLGHPKVVGLGEIGLDYYRDHASREEQFRCLEDQLSLASDLGANVVFHCRDAYDDLLGILDARAPQKYLFHCFAGDLGQAKRASQLGCWFGVDGPVTYKSAETLKSVLGTIKPEKIVIETDSPWMTPVPFRGQRNKPAWVTYVNDALAGVLGLSSQECADLTTANARAFFGDLGL